MNAATTRFDYAKKTTHFFRINSALLLPAALYFASNLTAMHALSHLRSSIFSAVMNARIVFAALLSMALLKKRVSVEQWRAIVIIVCAASILCLEDAQVGWCIVRLCWSSQSNHLGKSACNPHHTYIDC